MSFPLFTCPRGSIITLLLAVAAVASAQPGDASKTAAQVYKNIQILKDVPSTQFIPSMRFLATALGVECEFCHVGNRSVDTPRKQTARKMMTMMLGLNKQMFEGRTEITCYTCHKGSPEPSGAPSPTGQYSASGPQAFYNAANPAKGALDEVMAEAYKETMDKEEAARAAALPRPEQVFAKYVAALGGEDALRKVTSRVITSTTELSPNVRGTGPMIYTQEVQYFKAPNLYTATFQRFNASQTAKGFDGTAAWTQTANGAVNNLNGVDLQRAKRDADFYGSLNLKQEYMELTVRGTANVEGRDTYLVVGTPAGENPEQLYFDTQTGLLVRKSIHNTTPLGNYVIWTDYGDYREVVGGVKFPFLIKTVSVSPADTAIIHVEKVETNATIDASKFAKPPSKAPAR